MTLPTRHRIWNSSPGGPRSSTLPFGAEAHSNICFFDLNARAGWANPAMENYFFFIYLKNIKYYSILNDHKRFRYLFLFRSYVMSHYSYSTLSVLNGWNIMCSRDYESCIWWFSKWIIINCSSPIIITLSAGKHIINNGISRHLGLITFNRCFCNILFEKGPVLDPLATASGATGRITNASGLS